MQCCPCQRQQSGMAMYSIWIQKIKRQNLSENKQTDKTKQTTQFWVIFCLCVKCFFFFNLFYFKTSAMRWGDKPTLTYSNVEKTKRNNPTNGCRLESRYFTDQRDVWKQHWTQHATVNTCMCAHVRWRVCTGKSAISNKSKKLDTRKKKTLTEKKWLSVFPSEAFRVVLFHVGFATILNRAEKWRSN